METVEDLHRATSLEDLIEETARQATRLGARAFVYSGRAQYSLATSRQVMLTATPEQLGLESHFARLRLLDPDRYYDFARFVAEEENFKPVNALVQELVSTATLPDGLHQYLGDKELGHIHKAFSEGDTAQACSRALNALLDRHGTGRVLFRNTRAAVKGFPERILHSYPLSFTENPASAAPITDWLQIEAIFGSDWLALDEKFRRSYLVFGHRSGQPADSDVSLEHLLKELPPGSENEAPPSFIGYRFSRVSRIAFYSVGSGNFAEHVVFSRDGDGENWLYTRLVQ